jgi:hypothetical protein
MAGDLVAKVAARCRAELGGRCAGSDNFTLEVVPLSLGELETGPEGTRGSVSANRPRLELKF